MANAERVFAALHDPTRRAVLDRLRTGPKPVGEIARGLPVTRPAVSQHLKVLKDAGLVADRTEGTRRIIPHRLGRQIDEHDIAIVHARSKIDGTFVG